MLFPHGETKPCIATNAFARMPSAWVTTCAPWGIAFRWYRVQHRVHSLRRQRKGEPYAPSRADQGSARLANQGVSGEAQRRVEIWESEKPETLSPSADFLDAQVSSFSPLSVGPMQLAAPRATPPAGAGPGGVKTWKPENLKTCRAPQPRRFPGFQISRFPLPPPGAPRADRSATKATCFTASSGPPNPPGLIDRLAAPSIRATLLFEQCSPLGRDHGGRRQLKNCRVPALFQSTRVALQE